MTFHVIKGLKKTLKKLWIVNSTSLVVSVIHLNYPSETGSSYAIDLKSKPKPTSKQSYLAQGMLFPLNG